jgi:hypothetical protein
MSRIWRNNSLSIVMFAFFFLFWGGQIWTGHQTYNDDAQQHNQPPVSLGEYLTSGHFVEATGENWESEFLQMGMYVLLTVFLYQRGAADADPRSKQERARKDAPWPVRQGGWVLRLYENSLTLALLALFVLSFALHAAGGLASFNENQAAHGTPPVSLWQFMTSANFWFQSFQNWQSEFLSVGMIVVLSIFLRQKGSPESKAVAAPHYETGE